MFTGLLITVLILAGAATAVGGGLALAQRRRAALAGGSGDTKLLGDGQGKLHERTLRDMRVGDVVTYAARDFIVEGVVSYDEDGHRWCGARINDGEREHWLIVDIERLGQSARLLELDSELDVSGYPPETILAGGERYALDKRGTATCRFDGELGRLPGSRNQRLDAVERCRWWLYNAPGDETLVLEQWSGDYRALRGVLVPIEMFELIPGS